MVTINWRRIAFCAALFYFWYCGPRWAEDVMDKLHPCKVAEEAICA